jgi:outer membrane protein
VNFSLPIWVKRSIAIVALSSSANAIFAIDSLQISLDEVLKKALENSKYIEQAQLNLRQKETVINQSQMELLPKISLRGSASYATNMPIYENGIFSKPTKHDVIHYLYDTGADFYLHLYNGHRDLMKIESAKLEKNIAFIDWMTATSQIKMDVCNLYLDLRRSYIHKQLIFADIIYQREQLKQIDNLFKAGVVLSSDVFRISLELSKREMLLLKIDKDITTINQKLQFITGIKEQIVPKEYVFDKTLYGIEEIKQKAKQNAYILQKSVHEVQLKKLSIKQAKSNYLPELGLSSSFTFANPQIFLYPYNDSWYNLGIIGLKLSIPISSIYLNKNIVKSATIVYEREKVKHKHEEENLENQLLQVFLDYQLALKEKDVKLKNVDLAKENVRIIKNRYFKSAALITDLLDADMQLLQTLFELETAKIAIQKHYYFIEFLKGTI